MTGPALTSFLRLTTLTRQQDSACADIEICGEARVVSPKLAELLVALRPKIAQHACRSGGFGVFGDCIVGALLPHAIEHLAIDLLAERFSGHDPQTFAGNTTWLDRDADLMRVRVGCTGTDPSQYVEEAASALIEATRLMNQLL